MRRRSGIAIIVTVAIIVVGGIIALISINSQNNQTPAFAHFVAQGETILQVADSKPVTLSIGQASDIHPGDSIQGSGTLTFTGAELDLAPATDITLTRYSIGGINQIEVALKAGQILQLVETPAQGNVVYTVTTAAGSLATRGGKFLAYIDKNGATQFGSVYGAANVTGSGSSLVLAGGQGTVVAGGLPPTDPALWSPVHVTTYQPDGSIQPLAATLTSPNNQFYFMSGEPFIVPPGIYTLKVMALIAYQAHGLTLDAQSTNEFSITLGQAVFTLVDEAGTPVPFTGLALSGDEKAHAVPEQPMLISPGSSIVTIANDAKLDAVQPVPIDILPGQKATIPVRTALFGGARVKLNISAPEGITLSPVTINIYAPGHEDGDPIDTFSSDTTSSLLPPGDYVVVMPADISGRYPVTIANSQDVAIDAGLGTLSISYKDASGTASNPFMYVAAADEMQRLSAAIDTMQQTKYGRYVRVSAKLLVPEGKYNLRVDDPKKDVDVKDIEIQSRQNLVLPVNAADSP